jgi:hypothetical protein
VGKAMYGGAWVGDEASVMLPDIIPEVLSLISPKYAMYESYACNLLEHHSPEYSARRLKAVRAKDPSATILLPAEWDLAKSLSRKEHEDVLSAANRRDAVKAAIVGACENGTLQSVYRPTAGGGTTLIPREWWNTERIGPRFYQCQINPKDPYAAGVGGDGFCWIYLTSESLGRFLVAKPNSEERAGIDFHLSPYMLAMHAVARKMKIAPGNQHTKEEIMAELRDAWTAPVELSVNLEKAMATLLREVESQGGRANKSTPPKKRGAK